MGADFSKVAAHLAENLVEHAKRDGLSPVMTAVFLSRGGHAPGTVCPSRPNPEPIHAMGCNVFYDDDDEACSCGAAR